MSLDTEYLTNKCISLAAELDVELDLSGGDHVVLILRFKDYTAADIQTAHAFLLGIKAERKSSWNRDTDPSKT